MMFVCVGIGIFISLVVVIVIGTLVDCSVGMLVLLVSFMLASSNGSLFEWSRAWGLTSSDSLPLFLSSLLCN